MFGFGAKKVFTQTIGLRSNNPGNIRFSPTNKWLGQIGKNERGFVIFDRPESGLRALSILLKNYIKKTGQDTIEKMISKYAPNTENATDAYIASVAKATGINKSEKLFADETTLVKLVHAIVKHENGLQPYAPETIKNAVKKAIA